MTAGPIPLSDLLAGATADETLATLVTLGAIAGFPVTSWQSGSVPRTFFELEAVPYNDLTALIAAIASGGFVDYAEGPWLDLLAAQFYDQQRKPAVYTRGPIRLVDAGNVGPIDVLNAGELFVEIAGVTFRNITTGTLPLGGSLPLTFEALVAGAAGNVLDGLPVLLNPTIAGVTAEQITPPGGTWIAVQGADEESDPALRIRCRARWGELSTGATELAYRSWALGASAEVTRCVIGETVGDGTVQVYCAGTSGPVSVDALAAVQAVLNARRVQCVRPTAYNAALRAISLAGGVVKVAAAQLAAAQAAAQAAVVALLAQLPLGSIVYRAPVEAAMLRAHPAIRNVVLPFTEILLASNEVPVASFEGLTWTPVG